MVDEREQKQAAEVREDLGEPGSLGEYFRRAAEELARELGLLCPCARDGQFFGPNRQ